jgi:hypothetical protein
VEQELLALVELKHEGPLLVGTQDLNVGPAQKSRAGQVVVLEIVTEHGSFLPANPAANEVAKTIGRRDRRDPAEPFISS